MDTPERHRLPAQRLSHGYFHWTYAALLMAAALLAAAGEASAYPSWPVQRSSGLFDAFEETQGAQPQRVLRRRAKSSTYPKIVEPPQDVIKPQGPLIVSISIEKQSLKVYDSNGLFAETPVSTGTAKHPTPMGVFSIIEKQKWHRSNLYSSAPMPYMQRLTWSGVALHAGALPGYPASHGCIRMPDQFAVKLWRWTKRGARVIIAPGEISPADISHPSLLATLASPRTPAAPAAAVRTADASGQIPGSTLADGDSKTPPEPPAPVPTAASVADRPAGRSAAAAAVPEPRRTAAGPITPAAAAPREVRIAVLISRKDRRLYVRRNFEPVFDSPVTIADSDRPLGTHLFTARGGQTDSLKWSAVSLPVLVKTSEPRKSEPRKPNRGRAPETVVIKTGPAPQTAEEALGRVTIPEDAITRIAALISGGVSILVSDQGVNSGETGSGTDFIIPLR